MFDLVVFLSLSLFNNAGRYRDHTALAHYHRGETASELDFFCHIYYSLAILQLSLNMLCYVIRILSVVLI